HVYYSHSLFGPWAPHPKNPLKWDVRSARSAGRFMERGGRLFRPAQNCDGTYGGGLVWCEIESLSPTNFRERVVERWRGDDLGKFTGVHGYDAAGHFEVTDLKAKVRR